MGSTKPFGRVSSGTAFRLLVALIVLVVSGIGTEGRAVPPWIALVVLFELVAGLLLTSDPAAGSSREQAARVATTLGTVAAALGLLAGPSALPLVVIPLSRAGSRWGRGGLAAAGGAWAITAALVRLVGRQRTHDDWVLDLRWLAITLVVGVAAAWVDQSSRPGVLLEAPAHAAADEAASLLRRLETLTTDLEGGLDPATSAELLLDTLGRPGPLARSAVLVGGPDDHPVPLALRGADRVPWGDPLTDPGAVGQAWRSGRPVTVWDPEAHREVRAVPLVVTGGNRVGVLVQDVMAVAPSPPEDLERLYGTVDRHAPVIGVALSFASLRERAGFEERERLAREMHDGIAQELVALGFHLDLMARTRATQSPEQTAQMLESARSQLRRTLSDLRSHISDLRVSVRPERGLGATMTSRLQSFGTTTEVVVSLRLDESGFRLPARVETVLYQLFLDVLADVKDGGARGVDVDLTVVAPDASLRMRHDGHTTFTADTFADHPVTAAGGEVTVDTTDGLDLIASFRTPSTSTSPVHVNEKVPQPS